MSDVIDSTVRAKLRLMGSFRLAGSKDDAVVVSSRRARAVLAYLAMAPDHTATRERLCGLMWSDRGEAQARASLRECLSTLRDDLAVAGLDLIGKGREAVSIRMDNCDVDIARFQHPATEGDDEAFCRSLLAVGSSQLLEDLEIGGLFNDWLRQSRTHLDRMIGQGVIGRLQSLEARGRWSEARALAEAYLRRDPLDEAVVAAAIRAEVATGNTTAAYRRFQILQTALAKEFGVAPGAGPRDALRSADPAVPGTAVTAERDTPSPPRESPRTETVAGGVIPPLVVVTAFDAATPATADVRSASTIRNEVLAGLARFRDLRVMTDPRPFDGIAGDSDIERPGVYALSAGLHAGATDRRLLVQLVRTSDRHVIWSDRLRLPDSLLVETVEDIIAQVVGAVLPTINADLLRRPHDPGENSVFQRFLLAREAAYGARTHGAARRAAEDLEALIADHPTFAPPYLPLAFLYNTDFAYTRAMSSGPTEKARAFQLSKTALSLDRGLAHAYTVAGWCYLRARQYAPAETHFEQAISLNSFETIRLMEVGFGMVMAGRLDRARALLDRSLLLNPQPYDDFFIGLGILEFARGDHARAKSYFDLTASPDIWGIVFTAANGNTGGCADPALAAQARAAIAAIWPSDRPFETESVVAWVASHNPFRDPGVEHRFLTAVRQILIGR